MSGGDDQPPEHGNGGQPDQPTGDERHERMAGFASTPPRPRSAVENAARTIRLVNEHRRIAKRDPASDPDYDGSVAESSPTAPPETVHSASQEADTEILKRRRVGRRMSVAAVWVMGLFVIGFFSIASCFAWRFFHLYLEHLRGIEDSSEEAASSPVTGFDSLLPFIVPMMPAFFFSLLGLVTLITCTRFITSYVNSTNDDSDDMNLVERVAREIAGIIKAWKGGN